MTLTRRTALALTSAAGLSACMSTRLPSAAGTTPTRDPGLQPTANSGYDAWVAGFRQRAQGRGINAATLDRAFRNAGFLPGVVERDRNQTEFRRSTEDYLAIVASEEDVQLGRSRYRGVQGTLQEIEGRYGVPANLLAAVWGVESAYGTRLGDIPVVSATSTLAYDGRRGQFFESQLLAALRILQNGDTTADRMLGSWAGAMGHTQFIPTTYQEYAVDFRGDGRRDIWASDPTDALASAANYLSRSGWRRGEPWGMEIALPSGFAATSSPTSRSSVAEWRAAGVTRPGGGSIPDHGPAAIHAPTGAGGPGFLLFRNFSAILRYNNSTNYGIGVGYLSDRLAGGGPLRQEFGPDATGLRQSERRALQEALNRSGYDVGTPDGVVGPRTEAAISAYQRANGLSVTGQPSQELLRRLR